ncbi:hypothetical protein CAPTEDRAFT_227881 [Capitella teleta]|uniref:MARVEL domain-containing protein n=1 Tax=Capitella teleta TaxID=283909 RepID=R7UE20_CAPTE|nr:hypothetical protein CAPTEDRAFT_227881 [Capitella teleta]|eukprot:ELU04784.1 hypothetical protein CAPTEDRAFT_227881 [Capitella teleta]
MQSDTIPSFSSRRAQVLGWIQIVCGVVVFVLQCFNIHYRFALYFVGYGIWGGVMFIISGALTVVSAKQSNSMIVSSMVTSIVSAVVAAFIFACAVFGTVWADYENEWYSKRRSYYLETEYRIVIHSLVAVFTFLELIVAIVTSAFDCRVKCCRNETQASTVQYVTVEGGGKVPVVVLNENAQMNAAGAAAIPAHSQEKRGF